MRLVYVSVLGYGYVSVLGYGMWLVYVSALVYGMWVVYSTCPCWVRMRVVCVCVGLWDVDCVPHAHQIQSGSGPGASE